MSNDSVLRQSEAVWSAPKCGINVVDADKEGGKKEQMDVKTSEMELKRIKAKKGRLSAELHQGPTISLNWNSYTKETGFFLGQFSIHSSSFVFLNFIK